MEGADALCFKDKCFDMSFLIDVLELLSALMLALKEDKRVSGGKDIN